MEEMLTALNLPEDNTQVNHKLINKLIDGFLIKIINDLYDTLDVWESLLPFYDMREGNRDG